MKIKSVSARNFRTLEDIVVNFKAHYCAISGRNNAGKTAAVKILRHFLDDQSEDFFVGVPGQGISFDSDLTQWAKCDEMRIGVDLCINRQDDAEIFFVLETFYEGTIEADDAIVSLSETWTEDDSSIECIVNGAVISNRKSASEIIKKIKGTQNFFLHNSTQPTRRFFYLENGLTEVVESRFNADDRKKIRDAQTTLQNRVKKATKKHKGEIDGLLGKLQDKYQVEFSSVDRTSKTYSLEVKLQDRSVDVPLKEWGSGTQNRARILMSVLEAIRLRGTERDEDRVTPVFIVEEPESFLHPAAQAEFGRLLCDLATEHNIQIIATTHSPYMLNLNQPDANILLNRSYFRSAPRATFQENVDDENWMLPFSENLGILPKEFEGWEDLFGKSTSRVVLVEGKIDVEYFSFIKKNYPNTYQLDDDVDVAPYNGKDALKNTSILQFMIRKIDRTYVTFDLDAEASAKANLEKIGLTEGKDFCSIGIDSAGNRCIEGLLPKSIKESVYSKNVDLVSAMSSGETKEKNDARNKIKEKLLEEFKSVKPNEAELGEFKKLLSKIKKNL